MHRMAKERTCRRVKVTIDNGVTVAHSTAEGRYIAALFLGTYPRRILSSLRCVCTPSQGRLSSLANKKNPFRSIDAISASEILLFK